MEFNFNDSKQSIMDIKIKDPKAYRIVRDAMLFNVYEGWKPSQEDVYDSINNYYKLTPTQKERFQILFRKKAV